MLTLCHEGRQLSSFTPEKNFFFHSSRMHEDSILRNVSASKCSEKFITVRLKVGYFEGHFELNGQFARF